MVAQKVKVQCWGPVWSEKVGWWWCWCWVSSRSGWLLELLTELINEWHLNKQVWSANLNVMISVSEIIKLYIINCLCLWLSDNVTYWAVLGSYKNWLTCVGNKHSLFWTILRWREICILDFPTSFPKKIKASFSFMLGILTARLLAQNLKGILHIT